MTIVLLAPLPFGSNRPLIWIIEAGLLGQLLLVLAVLDVNQRMVRQFRYGRAALMAAVFFLPIPFWAAFQAIPLPAIFENLGAREYILAADALGRAIPLRISVAPIMTMASIVKMLCDAAMFYFGVRLFGSVQRQRLLLAAIALSGTAYAAWALTAWAIGLESVLWVSKGHQHIGQATGTFFYRNGFAAWIVIALCCTTAAALDALPGRFAGKDPSVFRLSLPVYLLCGLVLSAALLASGSRVGVAVGLVAVLAGLALWLAAGLRSGMKRLSLLIAMIALACVLGLIAVHLADPERASRLGEDFLGRYAVWHLVMGGIAERPWTGWGMGVFELAFPALRDESFRPDTIWDKAHNDYLETVFGLGLPAAICLLISLAIPVISCVRTASVSRKTPAALAAAASAGAIAIIAGFDFPMQIQAISLLLLLLIGAGCAGAAEPKRKDRRSWSPKLN